MQSNAAYFSKQHEVSVLNSSVVYPALLQGMLSVFVYDGLVRACMQTPQ